MISGLDRIGLDRISWKSAGWTKFASHWRDGKLAGFSKAGFSRAGFAKPGFSRARFVVLPLALLAAAGAWFVTSGSRGGIAPLKPAVAVAPALDLASVTGEAAGATAYDPLTAEAITPEQPTPMDHLRISSQTWRRGGLGSNALVSFTVRNNNNYAVKDIEISCAFARWDGSHLTDRTRIVPGTVEMRSRKTFAHMHVGFVNVNAGKAKCALVSATRM